MLPQLVPSPEDTEAVCNMIGRWGVSANLGWRISAMTKDLPFGLMIISGYRTCDQEKALPGGIDCSKSTHTSCPATGADLSPTVAVTDAIKAAIGREAGRHGLRWGGGAPVDDRGIPVDPEWRHVDLGPRRPTS